jgi:hypothetical protein
MRHEKIRVYPVFHTIVAFHNQVAGGVAKLGADDFFRLLIGSRHLDEM